MPMEKKRDYKGWTVYVNCYKSGWGIIYYAMYGQGKNLKAGEVRETEQTASGYAHQKIDEELACP